MSKEGVWKAFERRGKEALMHQREQGHLGVAIRIKEKINRWGGIIKVKRK